jgi:TetR/AcrR family acrAB operon transcriptional repressor
MARRTKEDAEKTRIQILEAALKVFSEKGYSKTTFVDISKEIGLTKGAVYWHFKTKTDLLVEMIAYGDDKFCPAREKLQADSIEELRNNVETYATAYATNEQAWNFEFFCQCQIEWSSTLMTEVHDKLARLREDPMKRFEQQLLYLQTLGELDQDKDARQLACCFGASWVGALNLAMYGEFDRKTFVAVLMNSFDQLFCC